MFHLIDNQLAFEGDVLSIIEKIRFQESLSFVQIFDQKNVDLINFMIEYGYFTIDKRFVCTYSTDKRFHSFTLPFNCTNGQYKIKAEYIKCNGDVIGNIGLLFVLEQPIVDHILSSLFRNHKPEWKTIFNHNDHISGKIMIMAIDNVAYSITFPFKWKTLALKKSAQLVNSDPSQFNYFNEKLTNIDLIRKYNDLMSYYNRSQSNLAISHKTLNDSHVKYTNLANQYNSLLDKMVNQ